MKQKIEKKSYIYYVIMFNVNEYCYCNGLFSYTDIDMTYYPTLSMYSIEVHDDVFYRKQDISHQLLPIRYKTL